MKVYKLGTPFGIILVEANNYIGHEDDVVLETLIINK